MAVQGGGVSSVPFHRFPHVKKHPENGGKVVLMARSGGFVMVRRPRCVPFVVHEKEWLRWDSFEDQPA